MLKADKKTIIKVMKDNYKIDKNQIVALIEKLKQSFQIVAPVKKNGEVIFKKIEEPDDIVLDCEITSMPPKEFFLLPEEKLFEEINNEINAPKPDLKPILIFGLKPDDVEAITYMDEIMSKPTEDFYYWQRRKNSVLVVISNEPLKAAPKCDLFLEKISENDYRASAFTDKGKKILEIEYFKKSEEEKKREFTEKEKSGLKKLILDSELLADAVMWSKNHKIWDELAKKCLGCGICTYVCPLCYCFSTEDSVSLDGKKCRRCRKWDACTLPGFSQISGGHSFRSTIKERYYNWHYHKFVRAYKEYGKSQCVGCERCQKYCPAGIDIEKVLSEILEEYKKVLSSQS